MTRVSILLPYHNTSAGTLKNAVRSILQQSFNNWELVLVSNANTVNDAAGAFTRELIRENDQVKLIHEPQKGIAYALNAGLQHCTGSYIARMDADDAMEPERLRLQCEYLDANPGVGLVAGKVTFSSELGDSKGYEAYVQQVNSWMTEEDIYFHRFVESPLAHPSVMFRRELVELYGNYSTAPVPEDYELWLRWMHNGIRMAKINMPVLHWKDHASRLSRTHANYSAAAFDQVRYDYLARLLAPRLPLLPPVYIWGGKLARKKVKLLEAKGIKISGYIDVKRPGAYDDFIHYMDIPVPGEMFIISMISNRGKYAEARDFLLERGYELEKDFVLAG